MEKRLVRRRPAQPLVLVPEQDGEYDDEADIQEMSAKIQEFLFGISKGYSMRHSCALSGCKEGAMQRWLDKKSPNYKPKLHTLFNRAQAVFYAKQVDKINAAKDWRAAAMWLERHEADWNPKETTVKVQGADVPMIKMDSDTINELSKAYDERFNNNETTTRNAKK
jgi:hypothetical protein